MTKSHIFIVLVAALLLSCSSNPEDEARQGKDSRDQDSLFSLNKNKAARLGLEVPPDLLESSNEKVRANYDTAEDDEARVLPVVIGATIQSDEGKSWLEIDADAEVVWRKLTEFWAFQEITLVEYHPESGMMETDWFSKTTGRSRKGFSAAAIQLFEALTAKRTALDKFTVRLERNSPGGTRVFVTHRSREKIAREFSSNLKNTDYEWVEREQDSEKIAQLLQTIVLLFDSIADKPA